MATKKQVKATDDQMFIGAMGFNTPNSATFTTWEIDRTSDKAIHVRMDCGSVWSNMPTVYTKQAWIPKSQIYSITDENDIQSLTIGAWFYSNAMKTFPMAKTLISGERI